MPSFIIYMLTNIDTVIFDFNGTILDDVELCHHLLNQMLIMQNHNPITLKAYLDVFTFPVKKYYELAGFDFKIDDFKQLSHFFINQYQPRSLECSIYDGVIDLLKKLKKNNKKIILLSASQKSLLTEQLQHFNILEYFDVILGIDNIFASGKLEIAQRYIKENPFDTSKAIMIGDTIHDYEVASALNIKCYLVAKGHQSKARLLTTKAIILDDIKDFNKEK